MINYIILILSVICICYTFFVSIKLNSLKSFIEEFKDSFYHFNTAAEKISLHISDFKDINNSTSIELEQKISQAILLINELQIMNDSTTQQIEILEKKLHNLKNSNKPNHAHSEKYFSHNTKSLDHSSSS